MGLTLTLPWNFFQFEFVCYDVCYAMNCRGDDYQGYCGLKADGDCEGGEEKSAYDEIYLVKEGEHLAAFDVHAPFYEAFYYVADYRA